MTLKDEYKRARQNLFRRMSAWKAKGIEVDFEIPLVPKKITRHSVERLKKIQLPKLIKSGKVISTETGEVYTPYSYEEDLKEKRAKRKKRRQFQNEVDIERRREQEDEVRAPKVRTKKEQEESERMSKRYHKTAGTEMEEVEDIEEQKIPDLDYIEDAINGSGITELINNWNYARKRYGDSKLWDVIQNGKNVVYGTNYAESFQDLLGLALKYQEDGNSYMANECARGCMEILQSMGNIDDSGLFKGEALIPLTAEDMAKLSEQMNYAP